MEKQDGLTFREILTGCVQPKTKAEGKMYESLEHPHLKFKNPDHYLETLAYAKTLGEHAVNSFRECFNRLERISTNWDETTEIYPDSQKHCFYFVSFRKGETRMSSNGGIILHGVPDTGNFNVQLEPSKQPEWCIHT